MSNLSTIDTYWANRMRTILDGDDAGEQYDTDCALESLGRLFALELRTHEVFA